MKIWILLVAVWGLPLSAALAQEVNMPQFSQEALAGKAVFAAKCSQCHGRDALGTRWGPPLLHPFYRPAHHSDASIARAIKHGVMAHHWHFGSMPPISGVRDEDIPEVIAFIRELQRANGIE